MTIAFPFSAIVGQEEMKLALISAVIEPKLGGILVFGDRGTGKSTAVRGLASLLPRLLVVKDCRYGCDPDARDDLCADCKGRLTRGPLVAARRSSPIIDLPLGATEDRITGALDLERALTRGEKIYEPGLLARAHRGFLYIDEVNLLEDHLVDLLLDVAASGENVVERDGLSVRHPARFVLIGSGNPEEGELRPQLLDRFGLSVEVTTPTDLKTRVEVVRRRDEFERDPHGFRDRWRTQDERIKRRIAKGRERLASTEVSDRILEVTSRLCLALGTDGLRGELTMVRAARALAAFEGGRAVDTGHLRKVAPAALRHRLRRNPLDETGSAARVERAMAEHLGP